MKHKILLLIPLIIFTFSLTAQNCEVYIPIKIGDKQMYQTKNKNDKVQSYYSQELLSIKEEGGKVSYEILHSSYDSKKVLTNQDTLEFYCKDGAFYIDMESYLNKEQLGAYDEAQIEMSFDNASYPLNLKPGMSLKDGFVQAEINVGITLTFRTDITNRKAEAYEDITTAAGTFKTIKVSEDVKSKMGFASFEMHTIAWVKMNIGNIRTESYDKKGNLISVTELISID